MNNNTDNVFQLIIGEQHNVKVEVPGNLDQSSFLGVYNSALDAIIQITARGKELLDNHKSNELDPFQLEFNNVITFTGERGAGKTSALLTVVKLLKSSSTEINEKSSVKGKMDSISGSNFYCLNLIDPSRLEPTDTVLGGVLSYMYSEYEKECKEENRKTNQNKEEILELEKAFQRVLKSIQVLTMQNGGPFGDPRDSESGYEIIRRLSDMTSLRDAFRFLVERFLGYMLPGKEDAFLVISLDDLDLNMRDTYSLSESIRKYMMIPRVIILAAMKQEQLKLAIEERYLRLFENTIRMPLTKGTTYEKNRKVAENVEQMANLYVEKIFPASRSIPMPRFASLQEAKIVRKVFIGTPEDFKEYTAKNAFETNTIEKAVLQLITARTGLFFRISDDRIHPFLPVTLRELHNFVAWIYCLPSGKEQRRNNLEKLRQYFLEHWISKNLNHAEEQIVEAVSSTAFANRNKITIALIEENAKKIIRLLYDEKTEKSERLMNIKNECSLIFNPANSPVNISIGDLLTVFYMLERYDNKLDKVKLFFAIRFIYTLDIQLALGTEISRAEVMKLAAGFWYNPGLHELVPAQSQIAEFSKDFTPITLGNNSLLKQYFNLKANEKPSIGYENEMDNALIWLSHFIRFGQPENKPRQSETNQYEQPANLLIGVGEVKNFVFDPMAVFFWTLFPEQNYRRLFGDNEKVIEKENILGIDAYKDMFNALFDEFYQIELLEYLWAEFRNTWNRRGKDVRKGESVANRKLVDVLGKQFETIGVMLNDLETVYGSTDLSSKWNAWRFYNCLNNPQFKNAVDTLADAMLGLQQTEIDSADAVVEYEKLSYELKQPVNASRIQKLTDIKEALSYYSEYSKTKDKVRKYVRELIIEFGKELGPKRVDELQRIESFIWNNRHQVSKRKAGAKSALLIADKLFNSLIVKNDI